MRRRTAALTVAAGCTVAAVVAWVPALARERTPVELPEICAAYVDLAFSAMDAGPGAQSGRRRAAAHLASRASRVAPAQDSGAEVALATLPRRVERVLSVPYATADDLMVATIPAAIACHLDWRGPRRVGVPSSLSR